MFCPVELLVSHMLRGMKMEGYYKDDLFNRIVEQWGKTLALSNADINWLIHEVAQWRRYFNERCDVQLDSFRNSGRAEAAEDCMEIVDDVVCDHLWGNDGSCGVNTAIKNAIAEKYNLPKAG